ncbi:MAG: chemotaxis protein CheW [Treponema sp.]|nr:chemotaxis protein CheW [Treponema sp.]
MNEEIINNIASNQKQEEEKAEEKNKITWLIFSINDKKYAIKSSEVHEIIRDLTVYKLPFLPSYIEGVINRRGDPFTVINPLSIIDSMETPPPDSSLFLILKRSDDQLSLHISDILSFYDIEESDVHLIPNGDKEELYLGTIDYNKEEIPALNSDAFELILRKDFGNA